MGKSQGKSFVQTDSKDVKEPQKKINFMRQKSRPRHKTRR